MPYAALSALVAGVFLGERLGPATGVIPIGIVVVGAVGLLVVGPGGVFRVGLALLVVTAGGAAVSQRALDGLAHSPLTAAITRRTPVTVDVTLRDDPSGVRFATEVLVRVRRWRVREIHSHSGWKDAGGRTLRVAASGDAAGRLALLVAGDHARLRGTLAPLEGYDERFRWMHAVGRLDASAILDFTASGSPLMGLANGLRATVLRGTATLPATERGLLAGFLLGDTRGIPSVVLGQFRDAGLSHLLAVSGENVAFVLALVGPLRRRLPRLARLFVTLAVLVVFGAMTRWEPSVLRAEAMAAVAVLAVHLGRPTRALRTLTIAAGLLLAADPFLVHSVGFVLSCGASAGIAAFGPPLAARLPGPEWFREGLSTTVAAQAAVAPVLLAVFGSIPLVAVPANLLAGPIVGPLTMWGLGAGVLGGFFGPRAGALSLLAQQPTRLLADAVLGIANAAGRVPVAIDARSGLTWVAALVVGVGTALWMVVWRGWPGRRPRLEFDEGAHRYRPGSSKC